MGGTTEQALWFHAERWIFPFCSLHSDYRKRRAQGTGSTNLPLHGGRVRGWLADRMTRADRRTVCVGGDGFMLSPIYAPGAIEEFVDLVVPELQRRGRFRKEYSGTTQRDHLGQDRS